jgi:hypothetical protein
MGELSNACTVLVGYISEIDILRKPGVNVMVETVRCEEGV